MSSLEFIRKLTAEREKEKHRRDQAKKLRKETESLAEKRERRIRKKLDKEKRRNEKQSQANTVSALGDCEVSRPFLWKKKYEKSDLSKMTFKEVERMNREKYEVNKRELEKLKEQAEERELQKQRREEEMTFVQRCKESELMGDTRQRDRQFVLKNARLRTEIRLREQRPTPIDLLVNYVRVLDDGVGFDVNGDNNNDDPFAVANGPLQYFENLTTATDLDDLEADIEVYEEIENGRHADFWKNVKILVRHALEAATRSERTLTDHELAVERRTEISDQIKCHIREEIISGKSSAELRQLEREVQENLSTNGPSAADYDFLSCLLRELRVHSARTQLLELHAKMMQNRRSQKSFSSNAPSRVSDPATDESSRDIRELCKDKYKRGKYEPTLMSIALINSATGRDNDRNSIVISQDEYRNEINRLRARFTASSAPTAVSGNSDDQLYEREAGRAMAVDETEFATELKGTGQETYAWSDKYRPRKPRYFNRVHNGFEWNKYNQTHYDIQNPPPKVVQGYKFNIFYPDLIDKKTTPSYTCTPLPENRDFAILKFTAGAPYEDIAFKIVNREWEHSYKRGFRSQFQNNVLQLWFHFKRYRYRR